MKRGKKEGKLEYLFYVMIFILAVSLIFFLPEAKSWTGSGAGHYNCSDCDDCSAAIGNASSGAIIYLNTTLTGIVNTCINFGNKSNVIFDCQNNLILGTSNGEGISLVNVNNNTVRNCNIQHFHDGIYIEAGNNSILTNISANDTTNGIYLYTASNNILTNISLSSGGGIYAEHNSNNLTVINMRANRTNYAIFTYGNNNNLSNILIDTDGYAGITLSSSNNSFISNVVIINSTAKENTGAIYLYAVTNATLINITLTKSLRTSGILLDRARNISIINSTFNYNVGYGIDLNLASNNTFTNIISNNNTVDGIQLYQSNNNIFLNAVSNNNTGSGVHISQSNLNNFTNITANYNSYFGVNLDYLNNNNSLTNITLAYNLYGLWISYSTNNTLTAITTKNNSQYGISISDGSNYNIIRNSFIQFNNLSGLMLNYTSTAPLYNLFYNNYFNNSVQYSNVSTVSANFFNTTKTAGTNIVGGTYIGGNYWAAPNGSGFSQTCSASTDGICDISYSLDGLNYDYLPLICIESWSCDEYGICQSGGTQTRTCTDANLCQTYKSKPAESQSCSYSGIGIPITSNPFETNNFGTIISGQSVSVNIINPDINVLNITMNTNKNITGASLTVSNTDTTTAGFRIGIPFGIFYRAFHITTTVSNEDLNNVTMEFRIEKTWLEEQNSSYNNVILYRIPDVNGSSWQALTTTSIENDSIYYYFSALSPGFSTFLILAGDAGTIGCAQSQTRCFNEELQICNNDLWILKEKCKSGCEDARCVQTFFGLNITYVYYGIIILVGLGIIILTYFFIRRIAKKKK